MSHSFYTTPAEIKVDKIIRLFLISVWSMIILFGILTLIQPPWLQKLSNPGRRAEAMDLKKYGDLYLTQADKTSDTRKKNELYLQAISNYKAALSIYPQLESASGNLAVAYAQKGDFANADSVLISMINTIPERAWIAYQNLGDLHRKEKDFEQAYDWYQKAVENELQETAPFPHYVRIFAGECQMELAKQEKEKRQPDEKMSNRERVYWHNARKSFEAALSGFLSYKDLYLGSLKRDKFVFNDEKQDSLNIENLILEVEDSTDENYLKPYYDEKKSINIIARTESNIAKLFYHVGLVYFELDKLNEAKKSVEYALQIQPYLHDARELLKRINKEAG